MLGSHRYSNGIKVVILLTAAACLGLMTGVGVYASSVSSQILLLMAIGAISLLPLLWRVLIGKVDYFEPIFPSSAAFALLFFARPLYDVLTDGRDYVGHDVSATYGEALVAVLVAVAFFQMGYYWLREESSRQEASKPVRVNEGLVFGVASVLTLISGTALVTRGFLLGGVAALFTDRSGQSSSALNVPFITELVMFSVPAVLMFWMITGPLRNFSRLASLVPLGIILVHSLPSGERRYLLPLLIAVVAFRYLRRGSRPSARFIVLAVFLVFYLIVNPVRLSRAGQHTYWSGLVSGVTNPVAAAETVLQVGDTEMVTTLALAIGHIGEDKDIPWQYGLSFLTETVLQPIPRQVWSSKPLPLRTQVIQARWGMENGRCVSRCPTFSAVGSLYADAGLFSVAAGSTFLGAFFGRWYDFASARLDNSFMQGAYSGTLFLPFFIWWSSLSALVIHATLYMLPFLLLYFLHTKFHQWLRPRSVKQTND